MADGNRRAGRHEVSEEEQRESESVMHILAGGAGGNEDRSETQEKMREENARSLRAALRFMNPAELAQNIWLFRIPLEPQREYMSFLLHTGSCEWEEQELSKLWATAHRRYRPLLLHRADELDMFLRESFRICASATLWQNFPETEQLRTRIFQTSARPAAVAHQLIRVRVRGCPYRVFTLLERDSSLRDRAHDLRMLPCRTSSNFTRAFLDKHRSLDELVGTTAHVVLLGVARQLMCTTHSTERAHSKNLRRSMGRAITQRIQLEDMALPHMAYAGPGFARDWKGGRLSSRKVGRPKKRGREDDDGPQNKIKRTGAAGPWRAFVNENLGGRQLSGPVSAELSRLYHQLSDDERARYRLLGQAGPDQIAPR